jgi:hypothetical protein
MLKEVYKKVEEEKKNEVKSSNITMSREDFISEHKNLIKVLRSGDKKAQEAEAAKQEKELLEETGEGIEQEDEEDEDEDDEDED